MYKFGKLLALMGFLVLGGCGTERPDPQQYWGPADDPPVAFDGKDVNGDYVMKMPGNWRAHVAVSTTDPNLLPIVKKLIKVNDFNVNFVPVPGSKMIIRAVSCSDASSIKVCTSIQIAGHKKYDGPTLEGEGDCDEPDADCSNASECRKMEFDTFRIPENEDKFVHFLRRTMRSIDAKK